MLRSAGSVVVMRRERGDSREVRQRGEMRVQYTRGVYVISQVRGIAIAASAGDAHGC